MRSDGRASVNRFVPAAESARDELVAGERGESEPNLNEGLRERVMSRPNLQRALHQVRSNRGAPETCDLIRKRLLEPTMFAEVTRFCERLTPAGGKVRSR